MEKKEKNKRIRSENWCEEDKVLLKELVKERVKCIENKNTDTNTNQLKKKAWMEVEENFNTLCTGGKRNLTQLKNQWVATKVHARKEVAEYRKELKKTGGGPKPQDITQSSDDICVWLPNEFVVDSNEFDSDSRFQNVEQYDDIVMEEILSDFEEQIPYIEVKESPKLKKKTSTKKQNSTDESVSKLTQLEMECRTELHELQMEVERRKIRNLDRELELINIKICNMDKMCNGKN